MRSFDPLLVDDTLIKFRQSLETKYDLVEEDWQLIRNNLTFEAASRNTRLHETGKIEKCGRLIIDGIIKVTCHDQVPFVFDFRRNGDYLCDIVSLTRKDRSLFSFETVTECQLVEVNVGVLMKMNERLSNLFSGMIVDHLVKGYERTTFLRISSAEDRYNEFCKMHPEIARFAKLTDIASYLDLTPQSLSRIRKKWIR